MAFYDLSKEERKALVNNIEHRIFNDFSTCSDTAILEFFSDEDTYIRKSAYQAVGRIYLAQPNSQKHIIQHLKTLYKNKEAKVRQTVINAAGEIGKTNFDEVVVFFDTALFDTHHSVRNAVIGSVKKMGQKNPEPILKWAKEYLHHPDKEIRREVCHGIELRGRTHPEDILPLLKQLQFDTTARVKNTLVHVLGQIAYKKDCLKTVIHSLNSWENKALVIEAIDEIIDVHERYKSFAYLSQEEAITYINKHFKH